MRILVAIAAATVLAACSGDRLTGPAAQDAVRQHHASAIVARDRPLIVVDGKVLGDATIRSLDPSTIQSVEVIKGDAAVRLYGDRGIRGVILIHSKSASR